MLAELHPGTEWTNWVGNQSFTPGYAAAPRDEEEVAALVRRAAELGAGVRVAAARHSFTPIVQTDGLLLDVSALNGVVATDVARRRATAQSGRRPASPAGLLRSSLPNGRRSARGASSRS